MRPKRRAGQLHDMGRQVNLVNYRKLIDRRYESEIFKSNANNGFELDRGEICPKIGLIELNMSPS
jgi:hypothetical protein